MHVKFIGSGPDDETKVCTVFGLDFFRGMDVDVSGLDDGQKQKLRGNRHFEVTQDDPVKRGPGRPRKVEADGDVSDESAA